MNFNPCVFFVKILLLLSITSTFIQCKSEYPRAQRVTPVPAVNVSAISGTTTEIGGTATFTMTLNSQPEGNVTINLTSSDLTEGIVSPSTVTFTSSDWSSAQTITVTGAQDYVADGNIEYTITTSEAISSDSEYNGMQVTNVTTTNLDDDVVGITVTAITGYISEDGASASFSVKLNTEPTDDVIITLVNSDTSEATISTNSLTFTSTNWNALQEVIVFPVNDATQDGLQTFDIVLQSAVSSDTSYSGIDPTDVEVSAIDNDSAGITVTPITGNTSELQTSVYFTVVLNTLPTNNVVIPILSSDTTEGIVSPSSLTFTSDNGTSAQIVVVTGVDDALIDGNVSYSILIGPASSTDGNYDTINPDDVTLQNLDNDGTPGFIVSSISGDITEAGANASFTISLTSQPTSDVTISLASTDISEGTVSPSSITFNTVNWASPQTIIITGVDDNVADGNQQVTIVTGSAISSDPEYNGLNPDDITVVNIDDDSKGIDVGSVVGTVTEYGDTGTFSVVLTSPPTSNVVISLSSSDTGEGTITPSSLTFTSTNWNSAQSVSIIGQDDGVQDGDQIFYIRFVSVTSSDAGYNNMAVANVEVTNIDNDSFGFNVSQISGITTEAGDTSFFTVALKSAPLNDVTLGISSSDTTEGIVDKSSLTFTSANWASPQVVTVTGQNDGIADGNQLYQIIFADSSSADANFDGIKLVNIELFNIDDDSSGISITPSSGLQTTEVGDEATFEVMLTSAPSSDVTLTLSSSDTTEGTVGPNVLTFTTENWSSPRTVVVTGADDAIADGNQLYYIITSAAASNDPDYNGINPVDISVINIDDENVGFTILPLTTLSVNEAGSNDTFTVNLNSVPASDVTLGITSSDTTEGTVSPASLTFTASNWNAPQTVTVTGVDDGAQDGNITYSIVTGTAASADTSYAGINPRDVTVTTVDDDTVGVTLTKNNDADVLLTSEGGDTDTFNLVLNSQPTDDVTIAISSNDTSEGDIDKPLLTFTNGNWNIVQTVTITGADDGLTDGDVRYRITIGSTVSNDASYDGIAIPDIQVKNKDNDTPGFLIVPDPFKGGDLTVDETGGTDTFDVSLLTQPTSNVTFDIESKDTGEVVVDKSFLTFTTLNWNAPQTVTVTGVDDGVTDGNIRVRLDLKKATSSDSDYNGLNPRNFNVINVDDD